MFGTDGRFYDPHFDFNRDGKLDISEIMMHDEIVFGHDSDEDEDDFEDELVMSGLDRWELEDMDEDERREALEDAGLDPDDFDF